MLRAKWTQDVGRGGRAPPPPPPPPPPPLKKKPPHQPRGEGGEKAAPPPAGRPPRPPPPPPPPPRRSPPPPPPPSRPLPLKTEPPDKPGGKGAKMPARPRSDTHPTVAELKAKVGKYEDGRLHLYNSGLAELPADLDLLAGEVRQLRIDNNPGLRGVLPPALWRLARLELLDLSNCGLGSVPAEIGGLVGLEWLSVDKNPDLPALPAAVGWLPKLEVLYIDGCPGLATLQRLKEQGGVAAVQAHLRAPATAAAAVAAVSRLRRAAEAALRKEQAWTFACCSSGPARARQRLRARRLRWSGRKSQLPALRTAAGRRRRRCSGARPSRSQILHPLGTLTEERARLGQLLVDAVAAGDAEVVRVLVQAGADWIAWGRTALQWAELNKHPEIVEMLRGAGKGTPGAGREE
eukprot:SAG22_NODE_214_length_15003_cov_18.466519_23_plen_406_part_00